MRERLVADIPRELAQVETKGNMLTGYASVFDHPIEGWHGQTTYIRSGAFTRTLKNNVDQIQSLFNHGHDPRYGELPIGRVRRLEEDKRGLYAEVQLHDGPDNDNIKAALSSGALRAMSIQFETIAEDFSDDRMERNIREVKLWEFGPVVFPANQAATASLHTASLHSAFEWLSAAETQNVLEWMWDGASALRSCDTASEFRQIAFERANDSDPDTAAHWTLPHHPRPGAGPDSNGVGAALAALGGARGGAPDLKQSVDSVRSHLQGHQSQSERPPSEARESTLDVAQLTWVMEAGRKFEANNLDLATMATRMAQLKEG